MSLKTNDVLPPGFRLHWYQMQSLLGDGGFGITYLGRDTNLNQAVAIKEYFPKPLACRGEGHAVTLLEDVAPEVFNWGLQRFLDEARLLARFRHPHIVRVLSVFESLGTAFIVMELERGQSLGEIITAQAISSEVELLEIALPLLDGLELVHESGFIHRDIKPPNILLRPGQGPVLIDFGSARQPMPGRSSELTAIVSRGYAPFEQYDAGTGQRQGPWTDIYGLAATLYHVVTGGAPSDALARGMCLLNGDPDPLVPATVSAPGRYSNTLLKAIDRGLAFRTEDRPQTIAEWRSLFPSHSHWRRDRPEVRTVALDVTDEMAAMRERLRRGEAFEEAESTVRQEPEESVTGDTEAPQFAVDDDHLKRRIMVLDDDRAARTLIQRVLANLGADQVTEMESGHDLLEHLDAGHQAPELLICDLEMPGMDGIEFLRHLAGRGLGIPVLLVSDGDERLLSAASILADAHGLTVIGKLRKPLPPDALSRCLASLDFLPRSLRAEDTADARHLGDDTLRAGIAADKLALVYLPKVSLKDHELLSVEALTRWSGHAVDIDELMFQVETLGLTDQLTDKVLHAALGAAGLWRASGIHCGVSVNLFSTSLARLDLPEHLVKIAAEEGITPRDITLEVNEARLQARSTACLEVMARLRLNGMELAIDDFGTGSATLEQLRRIPVTEIKVDRSFVASAESDRTSRIILESSVALARRLGVRAVAEGVGDERTWELVQRLGFDAAQGYFISPPLEAEALSDWCRDWSIGRPARCA